MAKGIRTEEDYAGWLGRLDVDVEDTVDKETFQKYLAEELGIDLPQQVDALWSAQQHETTFEEHGIHTVTVTYPWGRELRYGVQGMAGLWRWESVQKIRAEEEW